MEKYVKLQDVYDLLTRMHREPRYQHDDEDYYSGVSQVAGELCGLNMIELEEPKQGQWVPYTEYYADDYSECNTRKVFTCSLCGRLEKHKEPYCNCGAKMIKEN